MTQTLGASTQANQTLFVAAASEFDIERICREFGGAEAPPEAFMASSKLIEGQLLAMNLEFLQEGQQLTRRGLAGGPGLTLATNSGAPCLAFETWAATRTRRPAAIA